jgi:hypothetical protein
MLAPDFTPPAGWKPHNPTRGRLAALARDYLDGPHGLQTIDFPDWKALLDFCTGPAAWSPYSCASVTNPPETHWDLGAGWDGAVRMATTAGWPEGRDRMARAVQGAADLARFDTTRALDRDVAGAFPHVPLAIAGDPACMIVPADLDTAARPIVRVVVNLGRSGETKAGAIANLFGAVLSCVDAVEAAGQSVELTAIRCSAGKFLAGGPDRRPEGKGALMMRAPLKRAGEPLELDRMAFALAHPAFHRRLLFRFLERHPHAAPLADSYGTSIDPPQEPGTIYVPAMTYYGADARDPAHALAHALHFFNNPVPHPDQEAAA